MSKQAKTVRIDKETFDLMVNVINRYGHPCSNPRKVDYHEYEACGTCQNCVIRQKLKATGLKEFELCWGK